MNSANKKPAQLRLCSVDPAMPVTNTGKFVKAVQGSPMGWLFVSQAEAEDLLHIDFGGRATVELLGDVGRYWLVWHRTAEVHNRWLRVHRRRLLEVERREREPRIPGPTPIELLTVLLNVEGRKEG